MTRSGCWGDQDEGSQASCLTIGSCGDFPLRLVEDIVRLRGLGRSWEEDGTDDISMIGGREPGAGRARPRQTESEQSDTRSRALHSKSFRHLLKSVSFTALSLSFFLHRKSPPSMTLVTASFSPGPTSVRVGLTGAPSTRWTPFHISPACIPPSGLPSFLSMRTTSPSVSMTGLHSNLRITPSERPPFERPQRYPHMTSTFVIKPSMTDE
jgi:hypothetical protein